MDWTAADDIKKDPELDLSILSDMCDEDGDDEDADEHDACNEENCESQSESSYGSSQLYNNETSARPGIPGQAIDSTNIPRSAVDAQLCPATTFAGLTDSKINHQYLVAYLPTVASTTQTNPLQIRSDAELMATNAAINSIPNATATIFASTSVGAAESGAHSSTSAATPPTNPLDSNKYSSLNNQRITNGIVNYFLMDLAVQMDRLNDIAQMEFKIEISRLLLEKLKNVNNLRQTQTSICFTNPQNPN